MSRHVHWFPQSTWESSSRNQDISLPTYLIQVLRFVSAIQIALPATQRQRTPESCENQYPDTSRPFASGLSHAAPQSNSPKQSRYLSAELPCSAPLSLFLGVCQPCSPPPGSQARNGGSPAQYTEASRGARGSFPLVCNVSRPCRCWTDGRN